MPIPSVEYYNLRDSVSNLQAQIELGSQTTDYIRKSEDTNPLNSSMYEGLIASMKQAKIMASQIFVQFEALKRDFDTGAIVQARYKELLKPLYDLLTTGDELIKIDGFDTAIIAKELTRAGYN